MRFLELQHKIIEKNTTQEALAMSVGIDRSTFSRKLKSSGNAFTVGEMMKMMKVLSLSNEDTIRIFLEK